MKHETPRHPKLQDLASALNMPLFAAAGILELLWHYAGDFTPRGDIGTASDVSIARAVDWRKRPALLIDTLTATKWFDPNEEHRLIIHDWPDHAQEWIRVKLKRRKPREDWLPVYGISLYCVATDERQSIDLPQDGIGLGSGSCEDFDKNKVRENSKSRNPIVFDEHFSEFKRVCIEFGMPVTDADFSKANWTWNVLGFEKQQLAITGIRDRQAAGVDPAMIPRPLKYLQDEEWTRPIVRGNGRRQETAIERAIREA